MKAEQLTEMVKGFEQMAQAVKSGELKKEDLTEILDEMFIQIDTALELAGRIYRDEETPEISEVQKIAIKAQVQSEMLNFNYKENKQNVVTVLLMSKALDEEIEMDIIFPFMLKIVEKSVTLVESVHEEAAKAIRKGIKKYKKIQAEKESETK